MKFKHLALAVAVFVLVSIRALPAASPSGTLAVASGSTLSLGGTVTFDYTADNLPKSAGTPGVLISCYGTAGSYNGAVVWTTAGYADHSFVLGGSYAAQGVWGIWYDGSGGVIGSYSDSVHCVASLYFWSHNSQVVLATTEFDATGI